VVTGERRADARMVRAEAASGARRPAAAGRGNDLGAEVVVVGSAGSEVEVEVEVGGGVLAMADGNCSCFAGGKREHGGVAAGTGTQERKVKPAQPDAIVKLTAGGDVRFPGNARRKQTHHARPCVRFGNAIRRVENWTRGTKFWQVKDFGNCE
jgi:hypothetical protein